MTDSDALILAGLLAFGLAALSAILWGACVYWRGELRDYKAACWRLVAEAEAREKMIRRLQQERDGLVLQIDRLLTRVGELREGSVILGQLAADQLDRMRGEAQGAHCEDENRLTGAHAAQAK